MVKRSEFENQLSVIRVRKNYAAPYLKQKYLYVDKKDVKSEGRFREAVNDKIRSWPDGIYFLKLSNGKVFARLEVRDNKVIQVYRISPVTGTKYPVCKFFTGE